MKPVTYEQLDRALSSLGFSVRTVTNDASFRVYEHEQTGAMFWLAFRPDSEIVLPHHIAAAQGVLKVNGIADPLDFVMELQKAS